MIEVDEVILVLNSGSSSLKFAVFANKSCGLALKLSGRVEGLPSSAHFVAGEPCGKEVARQSWQGDVPVTHESVVEYIAAFLGATCAGDRLAAIGHRVVHGGEKFFRPTLIDDKVLGELEQLIPLAPLHQPHSLAPIRVLCRRRPKVPQVACFDTAFHCTQPDVAHMYALPSSITDCGVRRYGFHGLSYEYIVSELHHVSPNAANGKLVIAHLGNGASMCAVHAGNSVATTMGFSAADGLPMGTRCGSLDPGVILYMLNALKMDPQTVEDVVYRRSGLLGVSGISSDMQVLLASRDSKARLAIDMLLYRIGRELGSLAAALGGLDGLIFTGGIGEHATMIRERVCMDAKWAGIEIDRDANNSGEQLISTPASRVAVWTLATNEELMIARHTRQVTYGAQIAA